MSTDIIDGLTKEASEIKYKGIDLNPWLEESEGVTDYYVEAYQVVPKTVEEYQLDDIKYIDITTYDEDHNIIDEKTEWNMADIWNKIRVLVERPIQEDEKTEELILGDNIGVDDPNKWVQFMEKGKYRIGVENGEPGTSYHVMVKFETDAKRVEKIHFPVEIVQVTEVE